MVDARISRVKHDARHVLQGWVADSAVLFIRASVNAQVFRIRKALPPDAPLFLDRRAHDVLDHGDVAVMALAVPLLRLGMRVCIDKEDPMESEDQIEMTAVLR